MAFMEEVSEKGLGWPLGIGLIVAAVSAGPKLLHAARPAAKSAIKGYLAVQERLKESMSEVGERAQDLYVEAKHEFEEQQAEVQTHEHAEAMAEQVKGGSRTPRARKTTKKAEEGEESK